MDLVALLGRIDSAGMAKLLTALTFRVYCKAWGDGKPVDVAAGVILSAGAGEPLELEELEMLTESIRAAGV